MIHIKHKWHPTAANPIEVFDRVERPVKYETEVLMKCGHPGCRATKVKTITGTWSLSELR